MKTKTMEAEYGTKLRLLRILFALVDRPYGYTRRQLAELYNVDITTIRDDFKAFKNVGLLMDKDERHRYAFQVDKPFQKLQDLLHFSEEDQYLLNAAIDQIAPHTKRGERLKKKLGSLYDYHRLGHVYLRKPYLTKIDLLKQAKEEKRQVILKAYRSSNSNKISDRLVEPFHPSPPDDILHAFDVEKKKLRHFRISRFMRVQFTNEPWQYENHHLVRPTDPFRIVEPKQVMVHLRLKVGAYNELRERFPLTEAYIQPAAEEDEYDFQCKVNYRFFGLTNFILGHHHQLVEVVYPDALIEHLQKQVKKMNEMWGGR